MARIVQKYGGTSVGSTERIRAVAERISKAAASGDRVVAVVSAMGKTTDRLVELAGEITTNPCQREMDMLLSTGEQVSIALLSMALQELGQPAISLTGAQVGIVTEAAHSRARILKISPARIERHLQEGKVVVVAGFQGVSGASGDRDSELEITTLGRGGSDTSAVALAIALEANRCEIYTDVPGILTTDPRVVPEACLMDEITCDEMLELASLGATVLHPRAVELARNYGMPLAVRSSWSEAPGTRVLAPQQQERSRDALEFGRAVDAVEFDAHEARVALLHVPDAPGVAARVFGELSQAGIGVNIILQSLHAGNTNDIAFTVARTDLAAARAVAEAIATDLQAQRTDKAGEAIAVEVAPAVVSVAIVGAGMIGRPGIAARMFAILAAAGVNIRTIATSEVKVSCEINPDCLEVALQQLCAEFGLEAPQATTTATLAPETPPVRGVALDLDQARIALTNIPDRPGLAARIFGQLAECGISVDTILQSQRCHQHEGVATRDIYFTVARRDADRARETLAPLAAEFPQAKLPIDPDIAKVSIVGMGMGGTSGVATRFFTALAQQQINIRAITSAGLKVSCIVSRDEGKTALQLVHAAFGLDRISSTRTLT